MTGSKASRLAALCAAGLLLAGAAAAQTDGQATAPPRDLTGDAAPPPPEPQGPSGITVSQLGSYEGPAAGLLDDSNGGMGPAIWSTTPRADAIGLIDDMPSTVVPSLHDLERRVLETRADAPSGASDRSFQAARLRKLLALGYVNDAGILADNTQVPDSPGFDRVRADAVLFAGHVNDACSPLTQTRLSSAEPFWIELRAYCYAVQGDDAALQLTKAVMQQQGLDDDAFATLLDDVQSGQKADPGEIDAPNALDAYLMGQAGVPIPLAMAVKLGAPGEMLVVQDSARAPEDRLAAAEQVLQTGILTADTLRALASAAKFSDNQVQDAENAAIALPFLSGQALLRQAALQAADNDRKARLIAAALTLGARKNLFPVAAAMQADIAAQIVPDPGIKDLGAVFVPALLLAHEPAAMRAWGAMTGKNLIASEVLLADVNLLAPDPAEQKDVSDALDDIAGEIGADKPDGGEEGRETAALILSLYDALGQPLSDDAKVAMQTFAARAWPGRSFTPAQMGRIEDAAANPGRKAEAIMALIGAVGANGPGDLSPDTIAKLVRVLVRLGEAKAARDFAVEALALYKPAPPPPPAPPAPQP